MKKIVLIITLTLVSIIVPAQNYGTLEYMQMGKQYTFSADKKGNKQLIIQLMEKSYSDSTLTSCKVYYRIKITAKGKDFQLGDHGFDFILAYYDKTGLQLRQDNMIDLIAHDNVELPAGMSKEVHFTRDLYTSKRSEMPCVLEYEGVPLCMIESEYDPQEFYRKRQEQEQKLKLQREIEQRRIDSIATAEEAKSNRIFEIDYLGDMIGNSIFTKDFIEKEFNVSPAAYQSGFVYYSFPKASVSIEYNDKMVCMNVGFRLFGDEGYAYRYQLVEKGYTVVSKSKELVAENNFGSVQYGTKTIYRKQLKNGKYSMCEIVEGQAFMFSFYVR